MSTPLTMAKMIPTILRLELLVLARAEITEDIGARVESAGRLVVVWLSTRGLRF